MDLLDIMVGGPMQSLLDGTRQPRNDDEARFASYHNSHPYVFNLFDKFTRDRISRGFNNFSAHGIIMRIRWETDKPYDDANPITDEPMKISDHHFPYYARLWMERNPEYSDFFRTKKLKGEEAA